MKKSFLLFTQSQLFAPTTSSTLTARQEEQPERVATEKLKVLYYFYSPASAQIHTSSALSKEEEVVYFNTGSRASEIGNVLFPGQTRFLRKKSTTASKVPPFPRHTSVAPLPWEMMENNDTLFRRWVHLPYVFLQFQSCRLVLASCLQCQLSQSEFRFRS